MAAQSYDVEQKPGESLEKYYRRLAKTADQRLVRLEGYAHDKDFKPATQWAYNKAMRDIHKWSGPDALRFNTKMPEGDEAIRAKIADIKAFIESPTSTKRGIENVYKKRANTVNSRFGTKFTWQQLAKYYESGQAKLWDEKFGSKTALKTIGQIKKNKKQILDGIDQADKKDIRVDNAVLQQTVNKALNDQDLNIEDLF